MTESDPNSVDPLAGQGSKVGIVEIGRSKDRGRFEANWAVIWAQVAHCSRSWTLADDVGSIFCEENLKLIQYKLYRITSDL